MWSAMLYQKLKEVGFEQSIKDPCLYHYTACQEKPTDIIPIGLAIYDNVDDVVVVGESLEEVQTVKDQLKDIFRMSDMGKATSCILGIKVMHGENGAIGLSHGTYVRTLLKKF